MFYQKKRHASERIPGLTLTKRAENAAAAAAALSSNGTRER